MSIQTYIESHDLTNVLSETVNACVKFQPDDPLGFMADHLRRKTRGEITGLSARMVLDSRGTPTVEVEIRTHKGVVTAACPAGSCIGIYEKRELRDEDPRRFLGTGVDRCVNHINEVIAPRLLSKNPVNQQDLDRSLVEEQGPGNAVHPVSLAVCKAGAIERDTPLHLHLTHLTTGLPETQKLRTLPMFTILERGGSMFFHEVYLVPTGASSFSEAVRMGVEVFQNLKRDSHYVTGPNGGHVSLTEHEDLLSAAVKAISKARHTGKVKLGLNVNASELLTEDNRYDINLHRRRGAPPVKKTAEEMMGLYEDLIAKYPIHSIEDPFDADDHESFKRFTAKGLCKVLGTNVFCSCPKRVGIGARDKWCDALVLKPNQAGTLTDALKSAKTALDSGMELVVSDRTGSTDDPFVADLSVALNAHYVKAGAPSKSTIYNRILKLL
jgi:enolase